ncbi:MAG: hypothetical protein QM690_10415 [Sphingobium sp.]
MRLMSALALGLMVPAAGAVLIAAPATAQKKGKDAAPALKPSANFVKAYQEADKAIKGGDPAASQAAIAAAEQAASNEDDKYLLGSLKLNLGLGQKDQKQQRAGLEQMLASGKTPAADVGKFSFFVGQFALQDKDYDGAIQRFNTAVGAGYNGADAEVMLAESYFGKATTGGNVANNQLTPAGKQIANQGLDHLKKAIEAQKAAGQTPDPSWYSRGFRMAALSQSPDAAYWSSSTLKSGGDPENWRIALRTFQDSHKTLSRDESIDLLRLMAATGSLKDSYSYGEYADAALKAGLFGEVKSVIDKGRSAGHLQPTQFADIYKIASDGIPADRASLPSSESNASKAPTGRPAAATANAYLGYGDNAKAATLYRLALQKGGVNNDEINTRLGIALARSGDNAGAKAAFGAITTPGARKEIADYWTTWLDSKTAA